MLPVNSEYASDIVKACEEEGRWVVEAVPRPLNHGDTEITEVSIPGLFQSPCLRGDWY